MRVALLCETFSKKMGYLQSALPKYLARLGVETHVVTMDLAPYYQAADFQESYGDFCNPEELVPGAVETHDGYTLHVLGHRRRLGHMRMRGLRKKLGAIRPDIVQTMTPIGWIALDATFWKFPLGYRLFTGCHHHASVFPLASKAAAPWSREVLRSRLMRWLPGRAVSACTEKCYAIAPDCADVAVRFMGVPRSKMEVCPLGVDTELFHPAVEERDKRARQELRQRLGFAEGDIVCIYSGRFSADKNPLLLARAVERLGREGTAFRGLFVGQGVQGPAIESCAGCSTHPFVAVQELGEYFRGADVGVWPTQESMSMLDAAACGIPIVANHTMSVPERVNGNGATYRLGDLEDLMRVLRQFEGAQTRERLGAAGARKMAGEFSWESVARRRLADYEHAGLRAGNLQHSRAARGVRDSAA